jgi:uncharacterized protein YceH (UPF0502 family)
MQKFVKRIQSRLIYNGFQANMTQCREAYQFVIPESDWESPSDEQVAQVVQYVILQTRNDIQPEETALTITEPEVSEDLLQPIPQPEYHHPAVNSQQSTVSSQQSTVSTQHSAVNSQQSALSTQTESAIAPSIPQSEITGMVNQLFANQPPALKDQLTDYAMQHAFGDVRQVQEFLEQLRSMEFELMIQTLQDHMKRRGSMLSLLNGIISNQQHQDQEQKDSFFAKTQTDLNAFRQEMEARLAKQTL